MDTITTVGVDLAKNVFQVHAADEAGRTVFTKAVRRAGLLSLLAKVPPSLVGMEACATSHFWAREIQKLGHSVRLIPPAYVKPFVRLQKNDATDAAAICEAVTRPNMRFVPLKSTDQQSILVLHRVRAQLSGQRTALINALRAHLAEFGFAFPVGANGLASLREYFKCADKDELPEFATTGLKCLCDALDNLDRTIDKIEVQITRWHKQADVSRRLATIPGVGVIVATAIAASVPDVSMFHSGREFAAYLGLTPRQSSSGGKERLGRISKMGNGYLRSLLVVGATAVLRHAKVAGQAPREWANAKLATKPFRLVSVALANKIARIIWAVLARNDVYREQATAAVR